MIKKIAFAALMFFSIEMTAQTKNRTAILTNVPTYKKAKKLFGKDTLYYLSPEKLNDANVIGKEVVTYGKVIAVRPWTAITKSPMFFLNMVREYSGNPMTVMIFENDYDGDFSQIRSYEGKTIFVSGVVKLDKDYRMEGVDLKPSITVSSKNQIRIVQ